jgi:hypothetical protein
MLSKTPQRLPCRAATRLSTVSLSLRGVIPQSPSTQFNRQHHAAQLGDVAKPTTYFNMTFPGISVGWEASGVFLKVGKTERQSPA